jgi:hypothetical protein
VVRARRPALRRRGPHNADDGDEPGEGELVDADAAGGIGSAGDDFGGTTRLDFVGVAGGSIVDVRFTNTGGPDAPVTGPDTSVPPPIPVTPGDETPQEEGGADVLGFAQLDVTMLPVVDTTVRPGLVEIMPTLDPSQIPTVDPYANDGAAGMAVGDAIVFEVAPMAMDAANLALQAEGGFATLEGVEALGAPSDFAVVDTAELDGPGLMGFDDDGGDGMLGAPDGGPLP